VALVLFVLILCFTVFLVKITTAVPNECWYPNFTIKKLVAMATSLEESKKEDRLIIYIDHLRIKYLPCGEKVVKIGLVDPEITGL